MAGKNESSMLTVGENTGETNEPDCNAASDGTNTDTRKKPHRTKQKAGDTAEIPDRLPVITNQKYQNALTFNKNSSAYLQPLSDTGSLMYRDGILHYKGLPATLADLGDLCTESGIGKLNLVLLRSLYAVILNKISGSLPEYHANDEAINIYYPDFSKKIGKSPHIGNTDVKEFINSIKLFETVIGIVDSGTKGSDILPVLIYRGYNGDKNTISFSSPYIVRVIKDIYKASIRVDKKGNARLKKNGEPQILPSYSYLVDMGIVKERNKTAAEIVFIVTALIEQSGKHTPHIRASTVVERNLPLHKSLEKSTTGYKNVLLKRAFEKAWELLKDKTYLTEVYKNIKLPDPKDTSSIPTTFTLDMVYEFPHDGKNKKT